MHPLKSQGFDSGKGHEGRRYLMLQGPSSPFFATLGTFLRRAGATVFKVGFCPGDRLFWSKKAGSYIPFRNDLSDFENWLRDLLAEQRITDIIMLGDGRYPHQLAVRHCQKTSPAPRIWVVEHGYLRPDLILIEPDGMGGSSSIPKAFAQKNLAGVKSRDQQETPLPSSFLRYAALDVVYHCSNLCFSWLLYPKYKAHSGIHPVAEYLGWVKKGVKTPIRMRSRNRILARIKSHNGPLFLYPLQLSQDQQLKHYGCGEPQENTLLRVIESFTKWAAPDAILIVKVHPLDNCLTDWSSLVERNGSTRVFFLDGGNLEQILPFCDGVVTINSTVGLSAILASTPVKVLGRAIYDEARLTAQCNLDHFWQNADAPDAELAHSFEAFIRSHYHVRGSFDGPGAEIGAANLSEWLATMALKDQMAAQ